MSVTFIVNGAEVEVEPLSPDHPGQWRAAVPSAGRRFTLAAPTPEGAAENAWKAANPDPSPERVEAMRLAGERGERVCERCGGLGGWRGWPGFTCHACDGRRTV